MPCCGNRGSRPSSVVSSKSNGGSRVTSLPGAEGFVEIQYMGGNYGKTSFFGPVTGTVYKFGKSKPKGLVDPRDLRTDARTGLLDLFEYTKLVFELVPQTQPTKKLTPVKEVKEEEEKIGVLDGDIEAIAKMSVAGASKLIDAGYGSISSISELLPEELAEIAGWGEARATTVVESAKELVNG